MKVGRDYSWWVSYSWTYEWFEEESGEWISNEDFEAERFYCKKKEIKSVAKEKAIEAIDGLKYRNLKVNINDYYITTTEEL